MRTDQGKPRQLNDIWPECFGVLKDGGRYPIWRPHRLVSGHLIPGMVAVVVESEPYFRDGSGWHWRRKRGAKPRVFVVVAYGDGLVNGHKGRWMVGKWIKK